ncbi:hypothetical protein BF17_17300 [Yersinia similis]|uniref:Uncharacterized protein n=1 Tax=Yersinia similis TaxID=367190 RepID=A0ABN4CVB3_9GAMM|nr:hypothetical protein BF17_17300 [Yersinia similis]
MILVARRYWPVLLLTELGVLDWLHNEQLQVNTVVLLSPTLSLLLAWLTQHFWRHYTLYWRRQLLLFCCPQF